ncbi:CDP-alcohol phosphatidyltransferase [Stieleria neptunia]|uniref:CDP-alcohol phosphatidyltransferase n=1 Tax=Stieleria neptunia TaxID=2527979 RepID=A0A518I3G9_9BACT|nr:CDP-alcohol phosphatidyltransferase family protein [Stieleria neptunia]QDV47624.1 CDP-alcohol phosphatidyltransferase [Stieleria neptunia]
MNEVEGRRPLKTRQWKVFQYAAERLAQTRVTPNMISTASIVFGVIAGLSLAGTSLAESSGALAILYLAAAGCMQLRLIANLLDGMVAVEGGKASPVGVLYNEVPDRISDAAILIGAGYSLASRAELGLAAAVVAVFVAYVRAIGSSAGAGEVFAGPMAKPQRMALMTFGCVLCAFLSLASSGPTGRWQAPVMGAVLGLIIVGGVITSVRRLRIISETLHAGMRREVVLPSDDESEAEADATQGN